MGDQLVTINRAPVLTLWAAVVAERLGYGWDAALSLGKAVAGLNAQAKGRALGIYEARQPAEGRPPPEKAREAAELWVPVCGRQVPAKRTPEGVRAVVGDQSIDPAGVEGYLRRSFGDSLEGVRAAMESLAASFAPEELEDVSYDLYERFRPAIAPGKRGWGQKGTLDLGKVRSLARKG